MKTPIAFVAGFALCALLFVGMGAGPGSEYDRACNAVQAESMLNLYLAKDPDRHAANRKRFEHWIRVMEQFKP